MNSNGLLRGTSNSPLSQLAAPNETSAVAEEVNKSNLGADQKVAAANTATAPSSLRGVSNSSPSLTDLGTSNETSAVADEVNKSKLGFLGTDQKVACRNRWCSEWWDVAEEVNKSNLGADQKVAATNTANAPSSLRGVSNSPPSLTDLGTSNETSAVADEANKSKLGFLGTDQKVAC